MIDISDFEIGDVIELLPTAAAYTDKRVRETVLVLAKPNAAHLRVEFDDGRVEDHEARMAVLIARSTSGRNRGWPIAPVTRPPVTRQGPPSPSR